ncbi:MAG: site-specific integrase, partial [Pseudomonadota bacterium]
EHKQQRLLGLNERRFDKVVERFIELHLKPNTKNWRDTSRLLHMTAVHTWKAQDISKIDRTAVHQLIDGISEMKGVAYAREVRKCLSVFFNWAADRGICPFNPMAGMKRADLRYKPRERVLSLEELTLIWHVASDMGYPFGPIIQLLILTGQRRSEIAQIQRSWIDPEFEHFDIPSSEYKTGISHIVPLTEKSRSILKGQPIWNGGDFVFSMTNGKTPSSGFSKAKNRIDKRCDIAAWTFHDLRRSVATHMARLGVIQEHIERVLGHTIAGVAGTYNRYSYFDEKRSALRTWEKSLLNALK